MSATLLRFFRFWIRIQCLTHMPGGGTKRMFGCVVGFLKGVAGIVRRNRNRRPVDVAALESDDVVWLAPPAIACSVTLLLAMIPWVGWRPGLNHAMSVSGIWLRRARGSGGKRSEERRVGKEC